MLIHKNYRNLQKPINSPYFFKIKDTFKKNCHVEKWRHKKNLIFSFLIQKLRIYKKQPISTSS
ncbi:MAG TPA: hypothetical protein DEO71_16980 [Chryseobacterium sp.]|nr:hypothetical protein [Chryseobacterium sp.]